MRFEYDNEFLPRGVSLNEAKKLLNEGDIEKTYVDSSNIKAIWYKDTGKVPGSGVMYIEFLSDAVYEYHRVPEWVVELFLRAPSKGRKIMLRSLMATLG